MVVLKIHNHLYNFSSNNTKDTIEHFFCMNKENVSNIFLRVILFILMWL